GTVNGLPSWNYPNNGRPPKTWQTNVGIQRAFTKDMTLEASYVRVRGADWEADGLVNPNQITPQILAKNGLDLTNPDDVTLLASPMSSPAVAARFQLPYATFPTYQWLAQALGPY